MCGLDVHFSTYVWIMMTHMSCICLYSTITCKECVIRFFLAHKGHVTMSHVSLKCVFCKTFQHYTSLYHIMYLREYNMTVYLIPYCKK